jgi:hypothetical protein
LRYTAVQLEESEPWIPPFIGGARCQIPVRKGPACAVLA